jgi:aspartate racemase
VVGILGGMGPECTAAIFLKIIRQTTVTREQDHLRVIIDSNPKVPDRTEALLSGDTGPVIAALTDTARNLERAGAELIAMPCNTAHAFLAEVRASVGVPVLDMIDEAARRSRQEFGDGAVVGVLATDGSHRANIHRDAFARHGLQTLAPTGDAQRAVMEVIGDVKRVGVSDDTPARLEPAIADVTARGATALIAGCTEISLVLAHRPPALPWLDPLEVLAERIVALATGSPEVRAETPVRPC